MPKLLLVFGVVLVMTVTRSDGTVTVPTSSILHQQGRDYTVECEVTDGEQFKGWITPAKPARPGRPAIPSETLEVSPTGRRRVTQNGQLYILNVDDVSVDDGGVYECVGETNSAKFTFNVDITLNINEKQTLQLGKTEKIVLNVAAYPSLTYTWAKDGQPVVFDGRRTLDDYTGSITLNPVRLTDEGNYTCHVDNGKTSHRFKPISVQVTVPPEINKYEGEPAMHTLTEGNNVTFHCDVKSGSPKPTVTWYFGWNKDDNVEVNKDYDARYSHPSDEKWTITGIQTGDKRKYRCIASNIAGEDVLRFEVLQVKVPPTMDPITDVVVNEGANPTLQCKVAGSPIPVVQWFKGNNLYRDQTFSTEGSKAVQSIMFTNIQWVDSGKYTCKASNGAKDGEGKEIVVQQTISVNVNSPPKLISLPDPVYSFVGNKKNVTIMCEFSGYPAPLVNMVDGNGTEVASGNRSASFTIQETTEDVFGKYNCSAVNSNGRRDVLIMLNKAVAPDPPRQVFAETTCKDVKLKWEHPAFNGGLDITNYVIRVNKQDNTQLHVQSVSGSLREADINYRQFEAETVYKVSLTAQSDVGFGKPEMVDATTKKYCVPGKPQITNTDTTIDSEFTLTWSRPSYDGGDDIIKYKVEWRKKPISDATTADEKENIGETQLRVEGLEGGEEYEFKVFAKNRAEGISEPDIKSFKVKKSEDSTGGSKQIDPEIGARTDPGLGAGAIAGIVIAVILIVLITIDLFCCFFNSCGIIFCCHQALCGGGGTKKTDYKDGKATEMEKKPLPENV